MPARDLAANSRDDLLRARELEVEQPQRAGRVQPVDEMLDVLGGILLAHQARDGELQLTPVDHDRRPDREAVVLAGVIDVQVGVQDPPDVIGRQVELRELVLQLHLLGHVPGHAQPLHDSGVAGAGVDEDGLLPAEDQEPECRDPLPYPHVAPEHQETGLDVDVDEAEKLDLQGHANSPLAVGAVGGLGIQGVPRGVNLHN